MDKVKKQIKLKELIKNNNLILFRKYIQENEIKSKDFNNFDEILLYSIDINASIEIIEYILAQRQDKNLDYHVLGKIPLFIAIGKNSFKIANLLIRNGADINYEVNIFYPEVYNNFNIISYLKYGLLNRKNLIYILGCGLHPRLLHYLLKMLILYDYDNFLEIVFKYYVFDNIFILNLLHAYKNRQKISKVQLKYMISNEIKKVAINGSYYEFAERVQNYNAIKVLFENEYNDSDNNLLDIIIEYNLWSVSLKTNNYEFVEKVLSFKPFYYDKGYEFRSKRKISFIQAVRNYITAKTLNGSLDIAKLILNTFLSEIRLENHDHFYSHSHHHSHHQKVIDEEDKTLNKKYNMGTYNFILNRVIKIENFELVKYLVDSEDYHLTPHDINTKDLEGKSLIISALNCKNNYDIFKYLIDHGADGNTKDDRFEPLLIRAVHKPSLFNYLLKQQPNLDINARNKWGNYSFLEIVKKNKVDLAQSLINYANDHAIDLVINQRDADRNYPLLEAINNCNDNNYRNRNNMINDNSSNNYKINDNNTNNYDSNKNNSYNYNISDNNYKTYEKNDNDNNTNNKLNRINTNNKNTEIYNNNDINNNANIHMNHINNSIGIIKLIFEYASEHNIDLNINKKDVEGNYPLLIGIKKDNHMIIKLLMKYANEQNIIININEKGKQGNYPLLEAVMKKNIAIVKELINYSNIKNIKIDINERDKQGHSPLLEALNQKNLEISGILIKYAKENEIKLDLDDKVKWNDMIKMAIQRHSYDMTKLFIGYIKKYSITIDINDCLYEALGHHKTSEIMEILIDYANEQSITIHLELLKHFIKYNKPYLLKRVIKNKFQKQNMEEKDKESLLNYAYKYKDKQIIGYLKRYNSS